MASSHGERTTPQAVLALNTIAFALCFAAWVAFGPSSRVLAAKLHLSASQLALLKALPILTGSVLRIPVGVLTDRLGARTVFPLLMLAGACACFLVPFATTWPLLFADALLLGLVGATFAVGVQAVSSWTPLPRQGFALGILGSGNAGTALTTSLLPLLIATLGLSRSFLVYGSILTVAVVAYWLLMPNPRANTARRTIGALLAPLRSLRTWRFGLYYSATFGAFVGTTLVLTDIYIDAYHQTLKTAGLLATTFTLTASLARIPGGRLADTFGARRVLRLSLLIIVVALIPVMFHPPLLVSSCLILIGGVAMGIGMASAMRYIPDYFPTAAGAVGGIVGALGGIGGFGLTLAASSVKSLSGSPFLQVAPIVSLAGVASAIQFFAVWRIQSQKPDLPVTDMSQQLTAIQNAVQQPELLTTELPTEGKN